MAIKPFRDLLHKSFVNNLATRAWVVNLLRQNLGKLHFTGDVSQTADGHINFNGGGGAGEECSFPFRIYTETVEGINAIKVRVDPGYVRSEVTAAMYPTISGVAINRPTNPPWLTLPSNISTNYYVVLALTYTPITGSSSDDFVYFSGARIDSAEITLTTTSPTDVAPNIDWETLTTSAPGIKRIALATFAPGGTMIQSWWGNMHVLLLAEGTVWINSAA